MGDLSCLPYTALVLVLTLPARSGNLAGSANMPPSLAGNTTAVKQHGETLKNTAQWKKRNKLGSNRQHKNYTDIPKDTPVVPATLLPLRTLGSLALRKNATKARTARMG